MSVLLSLTTATSTTLGAVTATAGMITSTINSAAAMAQVMEINALAYRNSQVKLIASSEQEDAMVAEQQAMINVATKLVNINKQLADPELKAVYDQVAARWSAAA